MAFLMTGMVLRSIRSGWRMSSIAELSCCVIMSKRYMCRLSCCRRDWCALPVGYRGIEYLVYKVFDHLRDQFLLHGSELL